MRYKESEYKPTEYQLIKGRLINKGVIPLDKSWIIRMGFLDLMNRYGIKDTISFLKSQANLGDDLISFGRALTNWENNEPIDVGESATIFRFFQFASWKFNLNKQFIKRGTLINRPMTDDKNIVFYSIGDLLKLDGGTSEWASAAVLLGNTEKVINPPYKLKVSFSSRNHWDRRRGSGLMWDGTRRDFTILNQATCFIRGLGRERVVFKPEQAEDYCFARAFELITPEEGLSRWPSLQGQESNRIEEMERVLSQVYSGKEIDSKDHRAVQAGAMRQVYLYGEANVKYPSSVNKSWPEFWKFLGVSG